MFWVRHQLIFNFMTTGCSKEAPWGRTVSTGFCSRGQEEGAAYLSDDHIGTDGLGRGTDGSVAGPYKDGGLRVEEDGRRTERKKDTSLLEEKEHALEE